MGYKEDVLQHKTMAELQYVVSLYSDINYYEEYKVSPSVITNPHWRIYYMILEKMIQSKGITVADEVNVDLFVSEQSEKLGQLYKEAGGFNTIKEALPIIETENIATYHRELLRYEAFIRLKKRGFAIDEKWEKIKGLTYEQLVEYVDGIGASVFADIDLGEDKVIDITDNIDEMIERADKGVDKGLPVSSNLLNSIINGQSLGNITMLAGASGVGKTYLTLCLTLPNVISEKEKLFIMCNEEDIVKWQREILTWAANNIFGRGFYKSRFHQGNFTSEEKETLFEARDWMLKMIEKGSIKFVNFQTFSINKTISLIRKYKTQEQFNYFIIDTLKLDNDSGTDVTDIAWLQLQQNMVKLYNVIKPTAKNVHVWVTYQLSKSVRTRYLDQTSLGMSKNVADVVSTLLLVRNVLESEKGADSKALKVKDVKGDDVILAENKDYMICFLDKNRQGSTSNQVVWRTDKDKNILKDVGLTRVAQDY